MKTILSLAILALVGVAPISVLSAIVRPEPAIAGPQAPKSKVHTWATINTIKPGMTRQQVRDKLGRPVAQKAGWLQYWVGSQTNSVFIRFGNDGKVTKTEQPAG